MLTQEYLKSILRYDPKTGLWVWLINKGTAKSQSIAGTIDAEGYWRVKVDGVKHYSHRLAWFYMTGEWPKELTDHKNRIRNDNRWENLREATHTKNNNNKSISVPKLKILIKTASCTLTIKINKVVNEDDSNLLIKELIEYLNSKR